MLRAQRRFASPDVQVTPRSAQVATEALYGQNGGLYVRPVVSRRRMRQEFSFESRSADPGYFAATPLVSRTRSTLLRAWPNPDLRVDGRQR